MPDRTLPQSDEELRRAQQGSLQRRQPPTQVPGYDAERFLGAGAYGEVWVAVDRNTGRRVAIKFYAHRGGMDWSLLSREVEKLAFLSADRYVVQLFDVGWQANPPYYVMEYLERGSLEDRLRPGPLSVREAVDLFRDVAVGLVHSHGKGVLHCDLKPANVLLDQDSKPRLADFGQSRLSHEQTPALGTLFYMAPEQASLDAVPDARWDVYALGALFYCMLTGNPPHRSDELAQHIEAGGSLEERLRRYRQAIETAPRPAGHRKAPGMDRPLAEIVERCLAADPDKRYPNVQLVLDALDQRTKRRAQQPLLVMGALGPLLLLLVMVLYAWNVFDTVVQGTDQQMTEQALKTNHFAARFVAETVARQIDRRWVTLEQEAANFEFNSFLAELPALPPLIPGQSEAARQQAMQPWYESPARRDLQTWIESRPQKHPELQTASWFFSSRQGRQVARVPLNLENIGLDFSFRDYFHGQGDDLPRGKPDVPPTRVAHRSIVFESTSSKNRVVAFSVPVMRHLPEAEEPEVIGVLAMTVEMGHFAELRTPHGDAQEQIAVLADLRQDADRQRGSILEHPYLADLLKSDAARQPDFHLPAIRLDAQHIRLLEKLPRGEVNPQLVDLTTGNPAAAAFAGLLDNYADPVANKDPKYAGRWLAACEPVIVSGRPPAAADSGWAVIVQQRYAAATAPARDLGNQLVRRGLLALGVVIVVVTALWAFVILALTDSSLSRVMRSLRRSIGLPTATLGTQQDKRPNDRPGSAG